MSPTRDQQTRNAESKAVTMVPAREQECKGVGARIKALEEPMF